MSRWTRTAREPLPPAPGMILPGVPLAPMSATTQVAERNPDPLADPERALASQQARTSQPLPVRIVTPEPATEAEGRLERLARELNAPDPQLDTSIPAQRAALQPTAPVAKSPQAGPKESSGIFSRAPWPDPSSEAWPTTIPMWGSPPRGFGQSQTLVGLVTKDGTLVQPGPEHIKEMLDLVTAVGA